MISIASEAWNNISEELILKPFKLTGGYGTLDLSFLNHQAKL